MKRCEKLVYEAAAAAYGVLFENAEGTAASRTRKYIRANVRGYDLGGIAKDGNGKSILTQSRGGVPGKEQTWLELLERRIRDVFFHNDYADFRYEPGIARIAFEDLDFNGPGEDGDGIETLKRILKIISGTGGTGYDYNLNGESFGELVSRYGKEMRRMSEEEYSRIDGADYGGGSVYRIVEIRNFAEASEYCKYTNPESRWCITEMEDMWRMYTRKGMNRVYFALRDGYEGMEPEKGTGCPLDAYGLSMLCVIVTNDSVDDSRPYLCTCACRWNHGNGGSDYVMGEEQISRVVGRSFYRAFPPFTREELHSRGLYTLRERLEEYTRTGDTGIFGNSLHYSGGQAVVRLNGKYNYIDHEGCILSGRWFDDANTFIDGLGLVMYRGRFNYIRGDGSMLYGKWFDEASEFNDGVAQVKLGGRWNYLGSDGKLLSVDGFDMVGMFIDGIGLVSLDGRKNFVDRGGRVLSGTWFEDALPFSDGYAPVKLGGRWNYVGRDLSLLSRQWFDRVRAFDGGAGGVCLDGKWNMLGRDGRYLLDGWQPTLARAVHAYRGMEDVDTSGS